MPQTANDAIKAATFITDEQPYRLIKLPARAISAAAGVVASIGEPFCVLIADQHEVSLVLPDEAVSGFAARLPDYEIGEVYRLITVDAVLSPDLIGLMARLSTALANAEVGVFPYAAYTRDHILVPAAQLDRALEALRALQASIS